MSPSLTRKIRDATQDNNKDSLVYNSLLKNELLGANIDDLKEQQPDDRRILTPKEGKNMFQVSQLSVTLNAYKLYNSMTKATSY